MVDILGCILAVVVHAANIHDIKSGCMPVSLAWYRGTFEDYVAYEFYDVGVDISKFIKPIFKILPKRWVVERTFGWFG